jgi:hypothetical protein
MKPEETEEMLDEIQSKSILQQQTEENDATEADQASLTKEANQRQSPGLPNPTH